ncbi:hypothetical protein CCP4SC76_7630003 [Gammaproteobacteria bacterium]
MRLRPEQASHWIEEIWYALEEQQTKTGVTPDEWLAFLSEQYQKLFLLNRAILGNVIFVGAPSVRGSE